MSERQGLYVAVGMKVWIRGREEGTVEKTYLNGMVQLRLENGITWVGHYRELEAEKRNDE